MQRNLFTCRNTSFAILVLALSILAWGGAIAFYRENKMKHVTEIVVSTLGQPHPYQLHFVAQYRFVYQTGEFLVRRNATQQIVGGLAQSWVISEDRSRIIFQLRPNLYTAEDVAQSLRRLIARGQTSHSNFATQVTGIRVLSTFELELSTRGDAASVLSPLVMADAVILPDDHWIMDSEGKEKVDWKKTKGPYVFASGKFPALPGEEIIYIPNSKHYLYEIDQVAWRIKPVDLASLSTLTKLNELLSTEPSFCTIRYSNALKLFSTPHSQINFYQTKPNGVAYVQLNQKSHIFSNRHIRREVMRRIFKSQFRPLLPELRGYQIPQPGLTGRMTFAEEKNFIEEMAELPEFPIFDKIRWALPSKPEEDSKWHENLLNSIGLNVEFVRKSTLPIAPEWKNGRVDATFLSIGMSDTDPISGASFLFSPSGSAADLPNNQIMNLLNSAKLNSNPNDVSAKIREAFHTALQEAVVVPLYYTVNRHYYSPEVELNISDPFSEQIHVTKIRVK